MEDPTIAALTRPMPRWAWPAVPLLAVLAWWPVLAGWFVSDDFTLLRANDLQPWPQPFLGFGRGHAFYRPLSTTLTWNLGETLFGSNALPYHALSLGLHALVAWLLARTVATILADARLGWGTGVLFAVWPLSIEPVGWLAAQWDLWAAACGLAALWAFATFCRTGARPWYIAGLVAYAVGLLMKETILPLPLLLPGVAAVVALTGPVADRSPVAGWQFRARHLGWVLWLSLPFWIPTALFAMLRITQAGKIGGYRLAATDVQNFVWDRLLAAILQVLNPLNRSAFPLPLVQVWGLLAVAGLVALALWARRCLSALALGAAWFGVFLIPVWNLVSLWPNAENVGNRVLYWSLMGACLAGVALLREAGRGLGPRVRQGLLIGGVLLIVPTTWGQMVPWVQGSQQAHTLVQQWADLLVPVPGTVVVHAAGVPSLYRGGQVFIFGNGVSDALDRFAHQPAVVTPTEQLDPAALTDPLGDWAGRYNLQVGLDPATQLYRVTALDGVTRPTDPPPGGLLWDYRRCDPTQLTTWRPAGLTSYCHAGSDGPAPGNSYIRLETQTPDAHWWSPTLNQDLRGARGVRLAICFRSISAPTALPAQLVAAGQGTLPLHRLPLNNGGTWQVYWTYISAQQIESLLAWVRLDLGGGGHQDVAWVALTPIK